MSNIQLIQQRNGEAEAGWLIRLKQSGFPPPCCPLAAGPDSGQSSGSGGAALTAGKSAKSKRRIVRGENGQAMTEYLFLVVLCGLVCIPMVKLLPEAVRGYIRPFYYCISRPIP